MNRYEAALRGLKADLSRLKARWALVGGFAVSARGGGRSTTDIDVVATVVDDKAAEAFTYALTQLGYHVSAEIEQTRVDRLSTVRLVSPHAPEQEIIVDVIFATTGIEAEIVRDAGPEEVFRGLQMPVATRPHLIAMKVLSHGPLRPHDLWDLQTLLSRASQDDLDGARRALELIEERGFGRHKDLQTELDGVLSQFHSE